MIRLGTGVFLWVMFSLSAAASTAPEAGHDEVVYYADAYAAHYQIPKELVHALITKESGWNPRAISSKGAMGLMQLMPATAADYGVRAPFDVSENLSGGVRYLADLMQQFDGDFSSCFGGILLRQPPNPTSRSPLLRRRCVCIRCIGPAPLPCGARPPQNHS